MNSFDDVRAAKRGRSKGCPRCGDGNKNVGAIQIVLRELGPTGTMQGSPGAVGSKSKSFWESCAVEVYEVILDAMTATEVAA